MSFSGFNIKEKLKYGFDWNFYNPMTAVIAYSQSDAEREADHSEDRLAETFETANVKFGRLVKLFKGEVVGDVFVAGCTYGW